MQARLQARATSAPGREWTHSVHTTQCVYDTESVKESDSFRELVFLTLTITLTHSRVIFNKWFLWRFELGS